MLVCIMQNFKTEQIGLAISKDGLEFTRINNDGLILPIDPKIRLDVLNDLQPNSFKD